MARKTILVSDISGEEIESDQHATVTITVGGTRYTADVRSSEIAELISVSRKGKKRGRPAKLATA